MNRWYRLLFFLVIISIAFPDGVTGEILVMPPGPAGGDDAGADHGLQAGFTAAPTNGRGPLLVRFFDMSNGNPVRWVWEFGDGGRGSGENPLHTYLHGGVYSVRLTVFDGGGASSTLKKDGFVTVRPLPLNANFTADPPSGIVPLTVRFTDQSTGAMVWLWNFGDGSAESMLPNPTHTFRDPGVYTVRLTVSDERGDSEIVEQKITALAEERVTAGFTATPLSGPAPLRVQFTDRSSGPVTVWAWDFGDGMVSSEQHPVHRYTRSGIFPVTLVVSSDEQGSDTCVKEEYIRVTGSPLTGSLPLSAGWNFVSIPGTLKPGQDTAELFSSVSSGGHSAFWYDPAAGGWTAVTRVMPVRPLRGLWIFSTQTDSVPLVFSDDQPVVSRTLVQGWNAAGFTGFSPVAAGNALSPVSSAWQYCLGFLPELQRYGEMIEHGKNDGLPVSPYQGYWVYMNHEGILTSLPLF